MKDKQKNEKKKIWNTCTIVLKQITNYKNFRLKTI